MSCTQPHTLSSRLLEGEEVEKVGIEVECSKKGWAWKILFYFLLLYSYLIGSE